MKKFTYEEIIADAEAQGEALTVDGKVRVIPAEISALASSISGKRVRAKTLKEKLEKVEGELSELQQQIGSYLVEHPSGFFLSSCEKPEGFGIQRYADFSHVGGKPEIPTGEEAKKINRYILTMTAKARYHILKEKSQEEQ